MKKITIAILISIFFTPLNAKEVLFSDNDYIIIKDRVFTYGNDKIAKEHCLRKDKYFIRLSMNGNVSNKDAYFVRYYCVKSRNDFISNLDKFNKNLPKDFYNKTRDRPLKKEKIFSANVPGITVGKVSSTPIEFFPDYIQHIQTVKEKQSKPKTVAKKPENKKIPKLSNYEIAQTAYTQKVGERSWMVSTKSYYNLERKQEKEKYGSSKKSYLDAAIKALSECQTDSSFNGNRPDGCLIYSVRSYGKFKDMYEGVVWEKSVKFYEEHINSFKKKETVIAKKPKPKLPDNSTSRSKDIDTSLITIGSGSGFYINNKGYALTNNHVIDICKQSIAVIDGKETLFRVIATDKTNDVAVLKTDYKSRNFIKINEDGAKLGENVIAVGYPLAGRLSDSVKITRGIVSSLSGLDNNIGQIQIDAALQPGNSGGPVLNENGELVGIASAGLNKLLMAKEAKYIPENVNFAVASPIVVNILKSKKVKYTTPGMFGGSFSNTELAELGDSSTIQLFCRNTRAEYARLKKSKQYSQVLLDID